MKRLIAMTAVLALIISITSAGAGTAGGTDDPLISLSYMESFSAGLVAMAENRIDDALLDMKTDIEETLDKIQIPGASEDGYGYRQVDVAEGTRISVGTGGSIMLLSGTAVVIGLSGAVINITAGKEADVGTVLDEEKRYFAAENTVLTVGAYSSVSLLVDGPYVLTEDDILPEVTIFTDISEHWSRTNIEYLAIKGIVNGMGDNLFEPERTVTRGMFVTMLGRMCGVDGGDYTETAFTDVDIDVWYGPYVAWAAQIGVVNGIGDGTFRPNLEISREQMATIIVRLSDALGVILPDTLEKSEFADDALISAYATDAVYAAQSAGIINGRGDETFDPKGTATRAEICAVIYRYMKIAA